MLRLIERAIASVERRLVLLAPPDTVVDDHLTNCVFDLDRHEEMVRAVQRLRGAVYLEDGAVTREELTEDGLHRTPDDERAWHLLLLDAHGRPTACTWYRQHDNNVYFGRLRLMSCPLARAIEWRDKLWKAVESEIARARYERLSYAELGGWAIANESRHRADALLIVLGAYALSRLLGGALVVTTATTRHGSSSILSRLGGHPLEVDGSTIPPYYDPQYRCIMELLRFDSRSPCPRFRELIDVVHQKMSEVLVVARPYWPMTDRCARAPRASALGGLSLALSNAVPAASAAM